ncbi:hypothetical protein HNQ81_003394, partial [Desulfoprunum benzoelyticum]|nr:hypothetical protein [Desulfoprunum benzoelyticum]
VVLREYFTMVGRTDSVLPLINLSRLNFSGNQNSFCPENKSRKKCKKCDRTENNCQSEEGFSILISFDCQENRCSNPLKCTDYETCLKYASDPWTANEHKENHEKRYIHRKSIVVSEEMQTQQYESCNGWKQV